MNKVIWIDDEYDKQDAMFDSAFASHQIELVAFKTSKEGMTELENNLYLYDAVILDAKVFDKSEDEVAKLVGLQNSIYKLKELSSKRVIPYFVFTGQKDLENNSTFDDMLPGIMVFKKGIDNAKMFEYLKQEIAANPLTQLKYNYKAAFEVCTDKYIGEECQKTLLQILSSINKPLEQFDDELYFTQIRIMLEAMFRKANGIGLVHDKCLEGGKVNLSESSLFLSGEATKHLGVKCSQKHFPKIISDAVKSIIFITGAASHTEKADVKNNVNLQEYRSLLNTPYLLYSLTFQLMDILVWFKNYSDTNSNIEKNKALWITEVQASSIDEWIKGEVIKIADNGYGTFQSLIGGKPLSIIPKMVSENKLKVGDKIEVYTKLDTSGTKYLIDKIKTN